MSITGLQVPSSCFCKSTPPSPNEDASPEASVSLLGSQGASTGAAVRIDLIFSNACYWGVPQTHWLSFCIRSRISLVLSAKCSANLLWWFTIPRNTRIS